MEEIEIIFKNGRIRDIISPGGFSVVVHEYDTALFSKESLEAGPDGLCKITNWTRYPYKNGQQVYEITYSIVLNVRKGKVSAVKCPKNVKVTTKNE